MMCKSFIHFKNIKISVYHEEDHAQLAISTLLRTTGISYNCTYKCDRFDATLMCRYFDRFLCSFKLSDVFWFIGSSLTVRITAIEINFTDMCTTYMIRVFHEYEW